MAGSGRELMSPVLPLEEGGDRRRTGFVDRKKDGHIISFRKQPTHDMGVLTFIK